MSNTQSNFAKKLAPRGNIEIMEHAGFKARLMMAERLVGDEVHRLPPGSTVPVFPIAALPAAPEAWIREAGTYVCPVADSWGLWFDWTMNDPYNTAILPSVKGMNPITGQKISTIDLEQYKDKCPIHGCNLSHERFCEECGYKLPPQNYVCTAPLWWDGMRQPDGTVRQFFFTEDEARDVASAVIGKENTVPAFGFAFFKPKNPRVVEKEVLTRGGDWGDLPVIAAGLGSGVPIVDDPWNKDDFSIDYLGGGSTTNNSSGGGGSQSMAEPIKKSLIDGKLDKTVYQLGPIDFKEGDMISLNSDKPVIISRRGAVPDNVLRSKSVSVGAGARIRQELEPDTLDIKDWNEEASAIIRLYFVFEPQFIKMLEKGGIKDITGDDTGFLKDVPVG